jgi:hypothetical protein
MVVSSDLFFGSPSTWLFNQHASPENVSVEIELNAIVRKSDWGGAGNIHPGDALPKVCALLPAGSGVR